MAERPALVSAQYRDGGAIMVIATDRRPLTAADLVAPDGQDYAAERIDVQPREHAAGVRPDVNVGVEGGSASGVNPSLSIGLPIAGLFRRAPPAAVASEALIRIPAGALARADWPQWQIRLRFGPPGPEARYRVLSVPPDNSLSR